MSFRYNVLDCEEKLALRQFKSRVKDLKQTDETLIRYLRARCLDLSKAETMIRKSLQWREEVGLDNCFEWKFPPNLSNDFPYEFFGMDYEGSPICWMFMGRWKGREYLGNGGSSVALKRYANVLVEQGLQRCCECSSSGHVIIDLDGLTFAQARHIESMKLLYEGILEFELGFPEVGKSFIIINAPWIFQAIFSFIKSAIPARSLEKFRIFSTNKAEWLAYLLELFPLESISSKVDIS